MPCGAKRNSEDSSSRASVHHIHTLIDTVLELFSTSCFTLLRLASEPSSEREDSFHFYPSVQRSNPTWGKKELKYKKKEKPTSPLVLVPPPLTHVLIRLQLLAVSYQHQQEKKILKQPTRSVFLTVTWLFSHGMWLEHSLNHFAIGSIQYDCFFFHYELLYHHYLVLNC